MTQSTRRRLLNAAALASTAPLGGAALWPSICTAETLLRLVLPNAPGSGVDALSRAVAPALGRELNTTVVVDNQPGAGGVVGLRQLAAATPDGNTLSIVSNNVVALPGILKSLPFRMPEDFTPIALLGDSPLVLVANPRSMPVRDCRGFIERLKDQPDRYNYGSSGTGTILHLATAMFLDATGTRAQHVPYRGTSQVVPDLLGGQIDFSSLALPSVMPHIESGALLAIGMWPAERVDAAPNVPTLREGGVALDLLAWLAVLGPKDMAQATQTRLQAAFAKSLQDRQVIDAVRRQGNRIHVTDAGEARATFLRDRDRFEEAARKAGVEKE